MLPQAVAEQCPWPPPDAAPEAARPPAGDVDARIETRFAKLEQALLPDAEDGEGGA